MRGEARSGPTMVLDVERAAGPVAGFVRTTDGSELRGGGDVALAALLLPALRVGEPLEVHRDVSPRLLAAAEVIQDVFCTWDRFLRPTDCWYRRVPVVVGDEAADQVPDAGGPDAGGGRRGTACLFTGGVDSFHAVVTEGHRVDSLIYVHGFDVALDDAPLRAEVSERLRAAAAEVGLPLLELESDLQALGDRCWVGWPDYHGAAIATVAHALADRFDRLLVPATHTYAHLEGLGSHPLVDPLWSSELVEIEHVGAASTRVDKVRALAEVPAARRHLRVCWENRGGRYNCGRCEKCVRTGVAIRLAGAEGRFPTVPGPSLRTVASTRVTGLGSAWHELRNETVAQGGASRLRGAIDVALARHQLNRWRWTRRWVP